MKISTNESLPSEGPIVEWDQDQWWLDGKTRIKEKNKFFNTKKGKMVILGLIIIFLFLFLLIIQSKNPEIVIEEKKNDEELTQETSLSSLQLQIVKLRSQLEKADPAIKETPLPAVEMNVFIEVDKL